jgi:PPP family 3-phenylpropionic acid transporter
MRVFLTPLAGLYADRAPSRRFAVISLTLPAALVFALAWPFYSFWPLLFISGGAMTLSTLAGPPSLALALTGVRRYRLDFGRMRVVGSIAFAVANIGAGAVLGLLRAEATFWLLLIAMTVSATASFALPVTPPADAATEAKRTDSRSRREVLGNRAFLALMAACGLTQASQAMLNGFGSIEWTRLGFSGFQIGTYWAIGLGCEIALFVWSAPALRKFGSIGLLIIGAIASILRWSLFPLEFGYWGYAALQAMHGLTFGANALGTQHLIAEIVPERMTASAQGIYAMFLGLLLATTTSLTGPIYAAFGIDGFWFMVPFAAASLLICLAFRRYAAANRAHG